MALEWPSETVLGENEIEPWCQPASNRVLDFHGDPLKAKLVVFSDGNHHMALLESLKVFYQEHPQVNDIFYATTPPYPIVKLLQTGAIRLPEYSRTDSISSLWAEQIQILSHHLKI